MTRAQALRTLSAMADRAKAEGWHTPLPPQEHAQVRKALIALKGVLPAPAREALLAECLARTVCAEAGKPIKQARGEVARCIDTFSFAAAEARKLAGTLVPMDASAAGANKLAYIIREPIGVVGAISPFNFPLNLVSHKLAPAVAAGCPVVLKPASNTPLSGLAPAGILMEAGLPAGYLTVVVGGGESVGNAIVDHPDVRMTSFTGSPPVGWEIRRRQPRKEVTLELGNATPVLVAADADLDRAATKLAASGYRHAGQSCISVQRV